MDYLVSHEEMQSMKERIFFNADSLQKAQEPVHILNKGELYRIVEAIETKKYPSGAPGVFLKRRNITLAMTQYYLALRPKEACSLKFTDFRKNSEDSYEVYINGQNNKVRKSRVIQVPKKLLELFNYYFELPSIMWEGSEYVFPSTLDKQKPVSSERFKTLWRESCKKAGLYYEPIPTKEGGKTRPKNSLYVLRKTRASELLEASNGNVYAVASYLGHGDIRTVKNYITTTKSFKETMMDLVDKV